MHADTLFQIGYEYAMVFYLVWVLILCFPSFALGVLITRCPFVLILAKRASKALYLARFVVIPQGKHRNAVSAQCD